MTFRNPIISQPIRKKIEQEIGFTTPSDTSYNFYHAVVTAFYHLIKVYVALYLHMAIPKKHNLLQLFGTQRYC